MPAPVFTCANCGSHDLYVLRESTQAQAFIETLPCQCGETDDGIAARRDYTDTELVEEIGALEVDEPVEFEPQGYQPQSQDVTLDVVYCAQCADQAMASNWEQTLVSSDWVDEPDGSLFCESCDRPVPQPGFRWSVSRGIIPEENEEEA